MPIDNQLISDKIIKFLTGATPQTALTIISTLNLEAYPFTVVTIIEELRVSGKIRITKNKGRGYNGMYYSLSKELFCELAEKRGIK